MLSALVFQSRIILVAAGVIFAGVVYHQKFDEYMSTFEKYYYNISPEDDLVFTEERLAKYNGVDNKKLYLALLGTIFDVTSGLKHYASGGSYNYFVGKDGSRAFISGDFTDESKNKDHVLDLLCFDLFNLYKWKDTLKDKYPVVGVLRGRYYNKYGKETAYHKQLNKRVDKCIREQKEERDRERKHPPCNVEWNAETGSRVWCTKSSGGVKRNWVGVPRQYYAPGTTKPKCICVDLENETSLSQFKEYDKCPEKATSCDVDVAAK